MQEIYLEKWSHQLLIWKISKSKWENALILIFLVLDLENV